MGVQLDAGSPTLATGTANWNFAFPTGATAWKKGSSHTITVGNYAAGALVAPTQTIQVVQGTNHDINGDGYPDVVVSDYTFSSHYVYVYLTSGVSGPPSVPSLVITDPAVSPTNNLFGLSMALGDINGDGYADLVIAANGNGNANGIVYVYQSVSGTLPTTPTYSLSDPATSNTNGFGSSVALGDINGDGYADLAVGVLRLLVASGAGVYLYFSGGGGLGGRYPNDGRGSFNDK